MHIGREQGMPSAVVLDGLAPVNPIFRVIDVFVERLEMADPGNGKRPSQERFPFFLASRPSVLQQF